MNFPLFFSYCLVVDAEMILASLRGEGSLDCSSIIVLGLVKSVSPLIGPMSIIDHKNQLHMNRPW